MKNANGILIRITENLYTALGSKDILTILILKIYEHEIYFHLCLQFLSSMSYNCQCIDLLPPWLIYFQVFYFSDAIENGIVFISLSDISLLVYRS